MDEENSDVFLSQFNEIENAIVNSFVVDCIRISNYDCSVDVANFIKYIQKYPELPVFRHIERVTFNEEHYQYWFDELLEDEDSRYHKMLRTIYRQRKKELAECDGKIESVSYTCGNVNCHVSDVANLRIYNAARGAYFEKDEEQYYKQALQSQQEYEIINNEIKEDNRKSLLAMNEQSNLLGDVLNEDAEFRKCSSAIKKWNYMIQYITHHKDEFPDLYIWKDINYSAVNPELRQFNDFLTSISQKYHHDYWKRIFNYREDD